MMRRTESGRGVNWGRGIAPLALLVLLIFYPIAVLLLQVVFPHLAGFHPSWAFSFSGLRSVVDDPSFLIAARNSLLLGLAVSAAGTVIGTALGFLLVRMRPYFPDFWTNALWLLFFTPTFMMAQGMELFALPGGVGTALGIMPGWLSGLILSPVGVGAVLTFKFMPYTAIVVSAALQGVGQEYDDAARSLGASWWQRTMRVQVPLVRRAVLAGAGIIFAEAVSDFGVSETLAANAHFTLIPYQIYASLGFFPSDFASAAAQAFLLILFALLVQSPQFLFGQRDAGVLHGRRRQWRSGPKSLGTTVLLAAFFVAALGVPLLTFFLMAVTPAVRAGGLGLSHWTFANFALLWKGAAYTGPSLIRSYVLALGVAGVTTALGVWVMWAGAKLSALYDVLLTATIAVPGIVLAAAYVLAFDASWLKGAPVAIYGTIWALVFAYVAGGLPFAGRLARVGLGQIDQSAVNAVRSLGGTDWTALWRVVIPLMRPVILSTFLLMFTSVLFELPASELLYPPGQPTLAVAILHDLASFEDGMAAALSVLSVGAVALTLGLFRLLDRLTAPPWRLERGEGAYDADLEGRLKVVRIEAHSA